MMMSSTNNDYTCLNTFPFARYSTSIMVDAFHRSSSTSIGRKKNVVGSGWNKNEKKY
jgi:hypothetical protein